MEHCGREELLVRERMARIAAVTAMEEAQEQRQRADHAQRQLEQLLGERGRPAAEQVLRVIQEAESEGGLRACTRHMH